MVRVFVAAMMCGLLGAVPYSGVLALQAPSRGKLVGRVLAHGKADGLAGATIRIIGTETGAVTDAAGRFLFQSVATGRIRLAVEMIGYATRELDFDVAGSRTTEVEIALSTRPVELPPVVVTVRSRWLEMNGFYDRQEEHRGRVTAFARTDIEKNDPQFVTDLLRRTPGLRVHHGSSGGVGNRVVRFNREAAEGLWNVQKNPFKIPGCEPALYVDGVRYRDMSGPDPNGSTIRDWNFLSPTVIEAIEVYHSLNAPINYKDACGVILIWTRH